jgi:hypothetical protein
MKKVILCALALSVVGCKSTDIRMISDSVSDIASLGNGPTTTNVGSVYNHPTQQYSNKSESFNITENIKHSNEFGAIRSIQHEKNPKGMTMVRFVAFHQDSGAAMESTNYVYEQDGNGWLNEKPVASFRSDAIIINSGNYYLKSQAKTGGDFYASGMINIEKGVTNVVTVELQ